MADVFDRAFEIVGGVVSLIVAASVITTQNAQTLGSDLNVLIITFIPTFLGLALLRNALKQ